LYGKMSARSWIALGLVFVITTGTCRAQDEKTPADPDDDTHPAKTLAAQAGDPTAAVLQFQITNFLAPSSYNSDGYANVFNFQPIIPIRSTKKFPLSQIMRMTVSLVTTPGPDRTTGLGDISFFDLFVPKPRSWGMWGAGVTAVAPAASKDELRTGQVAARSSGHASVLQGGKLAAWRDYTKPDFNRR
jgi:hypothetical protein